MDLGIRYGRALIYGGSRGIGRAVAEALAAEGTDVAVCARKEWAAQKVASEATKNSGVRATGYRINAWDEPSTVTFVKGIVDDFGAVNMLFGVARRAALEDRNALSPSEWHTQLDKGFLRFKAVTETLLPSMKDHQWGRILWMIPRPTAGTGVERQLYTVMSAALSAWLESIAADLAKDNVTVNLLRPTPVSETRGFSAFPKYEESQGGSIPSHPDKTLSVRQAAMAAVFLLSDPAGGVFGRTIDIGRNAQFAPLAPKVPSLQP